VALVSSGPAAGTSGAGPSVETSAPDPSAGASVALGDSAAPWVETSVLGSSGRSVDAAAVPAASDACTEGPSVTTSSAAESVPATGAEVDSGTSGAAVVPSSHS
jgi:hypothetical protein